MWRHALQKGYIFLFVGILLLASVPAWAGGIAKGELERMAGQMGLRLQKTPKVDLKAGDSLQVVVISPEKLAQYGFAKTKRGDKLTIKVLDNQGKFRLLSKGVQKDLVAEGNGAVKLLE
jgi:hypothetical protein